MRILVACEESQAVTKAFRALGHKAFYCDILPCSGGHPEWHIQKDVLPLLKLPIWDMIIAFPPCTYLSNAGAVRMFAGKKLNEERYKKMLSAREFFLSFLNAPCKKIAVENPRQLTIAKLPAHTQEIQPFQFGEPYRKATRLWLKGLPPLKPTHLITEGITNWVCAGSKGRPAHAIKAKFRDPKMRSKTFPGIAAAMAEQWGQL